MYQSRETKTSPRQHRSRTIVIFNPPPCRTLSEPNMANPHYPQYRRSRSLPASRPLQPSQNKPKMPTQYHFTIAPPQSTRPFYTLDENFNPVRWTPNPGEDFSYLGSQFTGTPTSIPQVINDADLHPTDDVMIDARSLSHLRAPVETTANMTAPSSTETLVQTRTEGSDTLVQEADVLIKAAGGDDTDVDTPIVKDDSNTSIAKDDVEDVYDMAEEGLLHPPSLQGSLEGC